ncbi:hypothetical protein VTK73DRAFT_1248 [Phialemonium thermophilum]|uniref:Uncharacterized protein n=1 Tax=Phialemonium thermophilum TaxID=223376 RepID=A0ABR3Y356_9PEZI
MMRDVTAIAVVGMARPNTADTAALAVLRIVDFAIGVAIIAPGPEMIHFAAAIGL